MESSANLMYDIRHHPRGLVLKVNKIITYQDSDLMAHSGGTDLCVHRQAF